MIIKNNSIKIKNNITPNALNNKLLSIKFDDNYDKKFYSDFKNTYAEYFELYNSLTKSDIIDKNKIIIPNYNNVYTNFNFDEKKNKTDLLYNTELLLITNSINTKNLLCWIFWHKKIIKFEHIIIIYNRDNISNNLVNAIKEIDNTIEIIKKPGSLCQSELYTEYVNKSKAQWILPLDDDEFLYIPNKYNNNINTFIDYIKTKNNAAKYAFLSHFYFNNTLLSKSNDCYLNEFKYVCNNGFFDLCYRNNIFLFTVKTIVNTSYNHLYVVYLNKPEMEYTLTSQDINCFGIDLIFFQQMGSVHNPITKYKDYFYNAYSIEKNYNIPAMTFYTDGIDNSGDVPFVAHFKYTTISAYMQKVGNFNFTDVLQSYKDTEYNINFIYTVYDKIKPYLKESKLLFDLFQKNNGNSYINNLI